MESNDFSYLKCLSTGDTLTYSGLNNTHLRNIARKFEDIYSIKVDAFMVDKGENYFYPICSNVIVMLNGYYFKESELINDNSSLDPFEMFNTTDKEWYANYDKIVDFKKKDTLKIINDRGKSNDNLVEYLSSSGELITYIKEHSKIDIENYIAVDLDYFALKELAERDPSIIAICCDATVNVFQKNSISIATSNSLHHIPDYTKDFYMSLDRILTSDGIFIGIESQGMWSKIIINIISLLPRKIIPYSIKEIHTERVEIKKWLSKSIYDRLREANINSFKVRPYLFHCGYTISKNK